MKIYRIVHGLSIAIFLGVFFWLLPGKALEQIGGDAIAYSVGAINMLTKGIYSINGIDLLFDREIGMSVFLMPIYWLFGLENYAAVYSVQAVLYFLSIFLFLRELRSLVSMRVLTIAFVLFLTFPAGFHMIFSLNRELITFVATILFVTCLLAYLRNPRWWLCALAGLLMGFAILTFAPFLLLPIFLLPVFLFWRVKWAHLLLLFVCVALVMAPWAVRNYGERGRLCLTGCTRSAITWYVRGEQAEQVHGIEPLMCLWAEYVTRDWTNRSPACPFNKLLHEKWPQGFTALDSDLEAGVSGQQKILHNFPSYIWFSVFEVLELHLPYVNGWGKVYNILAVISTVILYLGLLLSLPGSLLRKPYALLWFIMLYTTTLFALTDAIPRYLMPIIFCYVLFSAIGYDWALSTFHGHSQHRHSGVQ